MQRGFIRRLIVLFVAVAMACAAPVTAQPAPYTINVILPLTGPAANLGLDEQNGLTAFEKLVNNTGGIRGTPLHFQIVDDQSQPAVAVQLFQQILNTHPAVVLGSAIAAQTQAMAALVKEQVVLYALTPNINPTPFSYVFATSAPTSDLSGVGVTYYRLRGITKIGVFVTTDASGQNNLESLQTALKKPANKNVKIVDVETFGIGDVSTDAQATKLKASGAQMVYALPNGTAFGTALHGLSDAGLLDLPIYTSAANFSPSLLNSFKAFLPKELTCSGAGFFLKDRPASDPQKKPIDDFYAALNGAGITQPVVTHAFAWDPALIVVTVLRSLGTSATAGQIHDAIEKMKNFPGVGGIYDFSSGNQHGAGENGLLVLKNDPANPGKTTIVSKQGGAPL
ncbi:MAG TPA: ABC transporter substrate-binding protein [Candidatus Lustribacter sp.]|jgi:branched-chain amino acid transport system substrate-binding protein|nr:ABC transporter substrate-binding protein [Candidatus Lustribacter sp.]